MVVDRMNDFAAIEDFRLLLIKSAIQITPVTEAHISIAREAFARFGRDHHPAKLNYGDCFAYALARETGEPLLFAGNDFGQTDLGIA